MQIKDCGYLIIDHLKWITVDWFFLKFAFNCPEQTFCQIWLFTHGEDHDFYLLDKERRDQYK